MGSTLVAGSVNGAIYGLIALGIVLVYKGSRVLNFAQGEIGTFALFVTWWFVTQHDWPWLAGAAMGVGPGPDDGAARRRADLTRVGVHVGNRRGRRRDRGAPHRADRRCLRTGVHDAVLSAWTRGRTARRTHELARRVRRRHCPRCHRGAGREGDVLEHVPRDQLRHRVCRHRGRARLAAVRAARSARAMSRRTLQLLATAVVFAVLPPVLGRALPWFNDLRALTLGIGVSYARSEERRVGKECRSR